MCGIVSSGTPDTL